MDIVIDTREQAPLEFDKKSLFIENVRREKLNYGDYSCRLNTGYLVPVFFERKSIADLFGTMGGGYPRFKKELKRAQANDHQLILIIEGTLTKVLKGYKHSTIKSISIVRKLVTLWLKHGLFFVCCSSRIEMAKYIEEFYIGCGKEYLRKGKGKS